MGDAEVAGVAVGHNGPVLGRVVAAEVNLEAHDLLLASRHGEGWDVRGAEVGLVDCRVSVLLEAAWSERVRKLHLAVVAVAALGPRVHAQVNRLVNVGLEGQLVTFAARAAITPLAVVRRLIVEHDEVRCVPVGHVVVDEDVVALALEDFDGHEEDAIVLVSEATNFILKRVCPFGRFVVPVALVLRFAPRVSHLEESVTGGQLLGAEDGVGVVVGEASLVNVVVGLTRSSKLNDVVLAVVLQNLPPKLVSRSVLNDEQVEGATGEVPSGEARVSAVNVLVGTHQLGESLLQKGAVKCLVFADVCEESVRAVVERQVVVNNHGVRNTKGVEVHTVDACIVKLVIYEDALEATRDFRDGRGAAHEPAVAEATLLDIIRMDTLGAEERVSTREGFRYTFPLNVPVVVSSAFTEVTPVKGVVRAREVFISELGRAADKVGEVLRQRFLGNIGSMGALVRNALSGTGNLSEVEVVRNIIKFSQRAKLGFLILASLSQIGSGGADGGVSITIFERLFLLKIGVGAHLSKRVGIDLLHKGLLEVDDGAGGNGCRDNRKDCKICSEHLCFLSD